MAYPIDRNRSISRPGIIAIILLFLTFGAYGQMKIPRATIQYIDTDFPITELDHKAWKRAGEIRIGKYWNGKDAPDGRHTSVRMLWSDSALYLRFDATQSEPLVVSDDPKVAKKTMRLWDRDVCELFLATDRTRPKRYAEFEIAPTGEWLDLMVDWTRDEPRDWEYLSGMEPAARIKSGRVIMAMKIPFSAFDRKPKSGDIWLGNLFRQVGSGETRGYLAWSPTLTETPQFHVPEKFGEFVFRD